MSRKSQTQIMLLALSLFLLAIIFYMELILRNPTVYTPLGSGVSSVHQDASINLRLISPRPAPLRALKHSYGLIKENKLSYDTGTVRYFQIKEYRNTKSLTNRRPPPTGTTKVHEMTHNLRYKDNKKSSKTWRHHNSKSSDTLIRTKRLAGMQRVEKSNGSSISPQTAKSLHADRVKRFFIFPVIFPLPSSGKSRHQKTVQSRETKERAGSKRAADSTLDDAYYRETNVWRRDLGHYRRNASSLSADPPSQSLSETDNTDVQNEVMKQRPFRTKVSANSSARGRKDITTNENISNLHNIGTPGYANSINPMVSKDKTPFVEDTKVTRFRRESKGNLWSNKFVKKGKKSGRKLDQHILYILDQIQMGQTGTKDDFAAKWIGMKRRLRLMGREMKKREKEQLKLDARVKKLLNKGDVMADQIMKARKRGKQDDNEQEKLIKKSNKIEDQFKKEIAKHEKKAEELDENMARGNSRWKLDLVGEKLDSQKAKMQGAEKLHDFFALHGVSSPMTERSKVEQKEQNSNNQVFGNVRDDKERYKGIVPGIIDKRWQAVSKVPEEDPDLVHVNKILDKILISRNARQANDYGKERKSHSKIQEDVTKKKTLNVAISEKLGRMSAMWPIWSARQVGKAVDVTKDNDTKGDLRRKEVQTVEETQNFDVKSGLKEKNIQAINKIWEKTNLTNIEKERARHIEEQQAEGKRQKQVKMPRNTFYRNVSEKDEKNTIPLSYVADTAKPKDNLSITSSRDLHADEQRGIVDSKKIDGTEKTDRNYVDNLFRGNGYYEVEDRNEKGERHVNEIGMGTTGADEHIQSGTTDEGGREGVKSQSYTDVKLHFPMQETPLAMGSAGRRKLRVKRMDRTDTNLRHLKRGESHSQAEMMTKKKIDRISSVGEKADNHKEITELELTIKQAEGDVGVMKHELKNMQDEVKAKQRQREIKDMSDLQHFMDALYTEIHALSLQRNDATSFDGDKKFKDMNQEVNALHEDLEADLKTVRGDKLVPATVTPSLHVHAQVAMTPDEKFLYSFDTRNFTAMI